MFIKNSSVLTCALFCLFGALGPLMGFAFEGSDFYLPEIADTFVNAILWILWPTYLVIYLGLAKIGSEPIQGLEIIIFLANMLFWLLVGVSYCSLKKISLLKRLAGVTAIFGIMFVVFNYLFLCNFESCPSF